MRPSGASQRPTCRSRSARRSSRRSCRRPTTCRRLSVSSSATSVQVEMPQMGISVSEGTILEWRKAVGDTVAADEPIADVTTDKVDVEIPCPAAGVLAKILAEPGETVAVGTVIAEIDTGAGSNGSAAGPVAGEGDSSRSHRDTGDREEPPSPTPPAEEASAGEASQAAEEPSRSGFI